MRSVKYTASERSPYQSLTWSERTRIMYKTKIDTKTYIYVLYIYVHHILLEYNPIAEYCTE